MRIRRYFRAPCQTHPGRHYHYSNVCWDESVTSSMCPRERLRYKKERCIRGMHGWTWYLTTVEKAQVLVACKVVLLVRVQGHLDHNNNIMLTRSRLIDFPHFIPADITIDSNVCRDEWSWIRNQLWRQKNPRRRGDIVRVYMEGTRRSWYADLTENLNSNVCRDDERR